MNCMLLILDVTLLLHSGLSSLPAPVNVAVDSHKFRHVLKWDPGPGSPPGTLYNITKRTDEQEELLNSNTTSLELLLNNAEEYHLTVRAFYNLTLSPASKSVTFTPYTETKIGPAELSLSGCGNCIQINISMPKPYSRSGIEDLKVYYDPKFTILWRKAKEAISKSKNVDIHSGSYTLANLEAGVEYCVQVDTKIRTNPHTQPSAWKCTFTSLVEPRRDSAVLGAVITVLVVVVGVLMISMFCLYYTGFLGKLQGTVPRALMVALRRGYTLTPETISTYLISDTTETEQQRTHDNPTASHAATRDANSEEDEEEEEQDNEIHDYLNRNADLSTDESSCSGTNFSHNCKPAESGTSGSLKERSPSLVEQPPAEFDVEIVQEELDQDDCKAEGATVTFISEAGQSEVQEHIIAEQEDCEVKEMVKACDSSGNVNLLSVTLAAMLAGVEEEQNTRDTLRLYETETPMAGVSKLTLINADTQMTDVRHAHTEEEEEEEEEDEEDKEFSGYMAHV